MIKDIRTMNVKGKCFEYDTKISFYDNEKQRIAIVFGRNGSGKSSIAEAFQARKVEDYSIFSKVEFLDDEDNCINISTENRDHIFVFNESFVESNIKLKEEGLDTIVMIGDQVGIDDKIKTQEDVLKKQNDDLEKEKNDFEIYEKRLSINNPMYHWNKIKDILKSEDGWVENELKITGRRLNVTDAIINQICSLKSTSSLSDLEKQFDEKLLLLKTTSADTEVIKDTICEFKLELGVDKKICDLLSKKIEKPTLTDRDNKILETIVNGAQNQIESAKAIFSREEVKDCPYCFQPISEEYKIDLVKSIKNVFNKDFEIHKAELNKLILKPLIFKESSYQRLDKSIREKVINSINACNDCIDKYNAQIRNKIENVYNPINFENLGLIDFVEQVNYNLRELEANRIEVNNIIEDRGKLIKVLSMINRRITYYKIIDVFSEFEKQNKNKTKAKDSIEKTEKEIELTKKEITELKKKKESVEIALAQINKGLEFIFFDKNRLKVEYSDKTFILKSNNKSVCPSDISCGERNILAMCYYFTLLQNNKNVSDQFKTKSLIILDDPISSFDLENRIGIHSYLKSQLLKILLGNEDSRIILLTHDLGAVYDFQKTADELTKASKKFYSRDNAQHIILELQNRVTKQFSFRKRNEYSTLIQSIYQYTQNNGNEFELVIGNMMRRVLEAFATFEYKKGISEVSCDKDILELLNDDCYKEYFENYMYRLVLNGESHFEEVAITVPNNNYYEQVTNAEKIRTAKDVLCFMYLLNPKHVEAHLDNLSSITHIKQWCEAIKST